MNELTKDALYHHGILGQKWGVRRFQPYGQGYDAEHTGKFVGKINQKKEYKRFKRSQRRTALGTYGGYASAYDRMKSLTKHSKLIRERAKELTTLKDKINSLGTELEFRRELKGGNKAEDLAYKMAADAARKQRYQDNKSFDELSSKEQDRILDSYVFDGGLMDKARDKVEKDDTSFKDLKKERSAALKEYKSRCAQIVNDICGEYGDRPISSLSKHQKETDGPLKYKEIVAYALNNSSGIWDLTYNEKLGRK